MVRMGLALADLRYLSFTAFAGAALSTGIAAGIVHGSGIVHGVPHFDFSAAGTASLPGSSSGYFLDASSIYPAMDRRTAVRFSYKVIWVLSVGGLSNLCLTRLASFSAVGVGAGVMQVTSEIDDGSDC